MDFAGYLQTSAKEINREIDRFFQAWDKHTEKISPKLLPLTRLFTKHCEGGKRLRGTLVRLGYELVKEEGDKEILKAAAAFEIFQTAILAHDDVIDLSPTRRGKETLYRVLGGDHYGISQTICLGDIGFFLAQRLILESNFGEDLKLKAVSSFTQTVLDTALGEVLDIELPQSEKVSEEDILTIFYLKTARYTISGPLLLGAILGGADEELFKQLELLGEKLGIAFQIQDDILGVFGDEETLGKSVTSDIEEGKQTLLISYALEHADKAQREVLEGCYGCGKIDGEKLELIKQVFTDTGALDYSQRQALKLVGEAKRVIEGMDVPTGKKLLLSQMADFLIGRSK